jgi:molybdopterin-guanine dinucleotide biosynthesis adapter protein
MHNVLKGFATDKMTDKTDNQTTPPILSIVGNSGSGKTTFIEKLIPELTRRGLRVGSIKHDVHGFQMDKPGKDSWRHKQAGASVTIISSPTQIGMVKDVDHDHTPDELSVLFLGTDLIITEGFKFGDKPKLEVYRPEATGKLLCIDDKHLLALISDSTVDVSVPVFSPAAPQDAAVFIITYFNITPTA